MDLKYAKARHYAFMFGCGMESCGDFVFSGVLTWHTCDIMEGVYMVKKCH